MQRLLFIPSLLVIAMLLFIGCSKDDSSNHQSTNDNNNQEVENNYERENGENNNENEPENNDESSEYDEHIEHQTGLQLGETGTVVDDDYKYEVTLNSVQYAEKIGDFEGSGEIFIVANITVKNIDDETFDAKDIFTPGLNDHASINEIFEEGDDMEQDLLEGEIEPGESVTGDHIFNPEETYEEYTFTVGGPTDQIHTYAHWEVSEDEIEE